MSEREMTMVERVGEAALDRIEQRAKQTAGAVCLKSYEVLALVACARETERLHEELQASKDTLNSSNSEAKGVTPRGGMRLDWWSHFILENRKRRRAESETARLRERADIICKTWAKNGEVKLRAGELTAPEMRAVRACLDGMITQVRAALAEDRPEGRAG